MKRKRKFYILIVLYVLVLVFSFLGFKHLYGSNVDWLSQHSVIPEYFRNLFYEMKRLIPNLAFNLGASQNIYNYSYYGLLSPVILISYLLPFISMTTYIQGASIILYILFGILIFKFIDSNLKNEFLAFICSLFAITMSAVNFNFHHHIMFVWYLPFLLMALLGVDKYLKSKNSFLLILSTFLIIMTNYYYSVSSLIVIFVYGLYKILNEEKTDVNKVIKKVLFLGLHLVVAVLMGMIIILPTFYCLKGLNRSSHDVISLWKLFIPDFRKIFYLPGSLGIIGVLFLAPIGNIFTKKSKVGDLFLNTILILVTTMPLFMFILNGGLYVRSKVLIPFIPLFIYSFACFADSLFKEKINIRKFIIFTSLLFIASVIFNYFNAIYIFTILGSLGIIYWSFKKKNKKLFYGYTFITLFICLALANLSEKYVSLEFYSKINDSAISELYNNIDDNDFYRSYNRLSPKDDANKIYGNNYYSPVIYSSTYNQRYWKFYNFRFGNNIRYRNAFMTTGTENELFLSYMGVKYLTSKNFKSLYYKEIRENGDFKLYLNENANPICYVPKSLGSYQKLKKLSFPYDMEYMMKNAVVNSSSEGNDKSEIKEYKSPKIEDSYQFSVKDKTYRQIDLDNSLVGKVLYISFDMMENQKCHEISKDNGDTYIEINGVKNKLTCKEGIYHNKNNKFQYVLPVIEENPKLKIVIGQGKYKIENVKIYYSDKIVGDNVALEKVKVDKKNSTITGEISLDEDNYLITSIPYDEGFTVYVNDEKVEKEIVNEAFLGAKLGKGKNNVRIEYHSPYYDVSLLITIFGWCLFVGVLVLEKIKKVRESK